MVEHGPKVTYVSSRSDVIIENDAYVLRMYMHGTFVKILFII